MRFIRHFTVFVVAVVLYGNMQAQSQRALTDLMRQRDEYYFSLTLQELSEAQAINAICSIDGISGQTVICYANQQEYDLLLQAGYQPHLLTPPSLREEAKMYDPQRGMYEWDAYLTYSQYVNMMEGFPATALSDRTCTLLDLGTLSTSNHRRLLGVRINNGHPDGKPKFLYSSTMHGDEVTGMILMLRLINELCTSTDTRIVNLVNNLDIYILPLTNPDGTYYGGNNTVTGARRYNGNGIDLNRNYKDYFEGVHPDNKNYADETLWTMQLADENLFTMGANYHGGAEVMNYPWDPVYTDHADKDWYEYICTEYVQIARQTYSSYMTDTYSDGVTNGATWYTISGSRQDYMNAYGQCREVTIECSSVKTPNASQLPNFWNYNHNSMLAFMEQCLKGVHGVVYDAETGQPLQGVFVTVQDHDINNSYVTSHASGDFHRPIKGGTYTFVFERYGYCPQLVDVTVADGETINLIVELSPGTSCLTPIFSASDTELSIGQSINFTDGSYGDITSWQWTFEGATPSSSTQRNPSGITYNQSGDYSVTLTITDANGHSETLTKENYIHVSEAYNMQNGTFETCGAMFYDSGGPEANYSSNLDYTMTFKPSSPGAKIRVNFLSFALENAGSSWSGTTVYDYLKIYDGTSSSATLVGQYYGSNSPGTVTATNSSGALTFVFHSDQYSEKSGWKATVDCVFTDYEITATANPTNGGSITGAGTYQQGQSCTLTATPATGYTFINWTKNGTQISTNPSYTFTVTESAAYVAHFQLQSFNINATAEPADGGEITGEGSYNYGQSCTLTATPAAGYTFLNWTKNGMQVSTNASYTFTVTESAAYVAHFQLQSFNINATAEPTDGGEITGEGSYNYGQSCTLTATPATGYTLLNWTKNGIQVSTDASYTFTVTESAAYVAHFQLQSFTINATAEPADGGEITGEGSYNYGQSCTLSATAHQGYTFTNWTENGEVVSDNANFTFTVSSNRNLVAHFTVNAYTITASANPSNGGTVSGGGTYNYGESCTLTATSAPGYNFVNWTENGVQVSTEANYTFTVDGSHNLIAHFTTNAYTITASANPSQGGTVTGSGGYNYGQSCTITATPATGYNFVKWTKNGVEVSTNTQYTFTVTESAAYVAHFQAQTYTISATANPSQGGTINGGGSYTYGQNCILLATPAAGYTFVNWTKNGTEVSTRARYTFTVTESAAYVAHFQLQNFTITATANPIEGGRVSGGGTYSFGQSCTLTATPTSGYTFLNWTENGNVVSTAARYSFNVEDSRTLVANFEQQTVVIKAMANPEQSAVITGSGTYHLGETVTLSVQPNNDYEFTEWTENGHVVSSHATYTFTATTDRVLVAQLKYVDGVSENAASRIQLYPNPVKDLLTIEAPEDIDQLEIYNLTGMLVYSQKNCANSVDIRTSDLASGTYLVRMTTKSVSEIRKFVKE